MKVFNNQVINRFGLLLCFSALFASAFVPIPLARIQPTRFFIPSSSSQAPTPPPVLYYYGRLCHKQKSKSCLHNLRGQENRSENNHIGFPSSSASEDEICRSNASDVTERSTNILPKNKKNKNGLSQIIISFLLCLTVMTTTTIVSPSYGSSNVAMAADDSMRYWNIMQSGTPELKSRANEVLLDHAVGTINNVYYDNSGGARFVPTEFYKKWKALKESANSNLDRNHRIGRKAPYSSSSNNHGTVVPSDITFETREGAVQGLKWLVGNLNDPFSKYLTREELRRELEQRSDGFLGLGAIVEPPSTDDLVLLQQLPSNIKQERNQMRSTFALAPSERLVVASSKNQQLNQNTLSVSRAINLPMVTAVIPDSPAERAGIVVGDRIVSVGEDKFTDESLKGVSMHLQTKYSAENYFGYPYLTIAKPLFQDSEDRVIIAGYRLSRVRLPTTLVEQFRPYSLTPNVMSGHGNSVVHYELLTPQNSILDKTTSDKVGYIRLTRFSRASTDGYIKAIQDLEAAGASSFIIDLRNNYGGVIQEAMLTASTLLRDPYSVLCYTLNARGGFTPHYASEYAVNPRYPGYLLSKEPRTVTKDQVKRSNLETFDYDGILWVPPSSYLSLHEQYTKRGVHRISLRTNIETNDGVQPIAAFIPGQKDIESPLHRILSSDQQQRLLQAHAQNKVVLLINEGTASSAEMFAAALQDNGRATLVGTQTYGKGLIQHTFPMPDGGGIRLTVAEYLTPSLHHVTHVGNARFDRNTGELIRGGIRPNVFCDSREGIPTNVGADLCVGVAFDVIEEVKEADDKTFEALYARALQQPLLLLQLVLSSLF